MAGKGIHHVALTVGDVERSLAFSVPRSAARRRRHAPVLRRGDRALGFEVDRPEEVDEAYGRCLGAGATIKSPPEFHYVEDGEDYYAFFAFDPDGIRFEVFYWERASA